MRHESLKSVTTYEKVLQLQDHGNLYPYYPVDVVQKMLRPYLIQELKKIVLNPRRKKLIEATVDRCFQGREP